MPVLKGNRIRPVLPNGTEDARPRDLKTVEGNLRGFESLSLRFMSRRLVASRRAAALRLSVFELRVAKDGESCGAQSPRSRDPDLAALHQARCMTAR